MIAVDHSLCDGCETCIEACPTTAIVMEEQKAKGTEDCVDCGLCVEQCPKGAISINT